MALQNIVKNALNSIQQGRRRTQRQQASEVRIEALESRALLTLIGAEVTAHAFAQDGSQIGNAGFAVVESRSEPELAQLGGQYDINFTGSSISLVNNLSTNAGTSVRQIDLRFAGLAPDQVITAVTADPGQTLVPNVQLLADNVVRIEIAAGTPTGQGFNALINVEVTEISVPLIGRDVTVSSTTQSNLGTGGVEVPTGTPATVTVDDGVTDPELISFVDTYDIDIDAQTIAMNFNLAQGASNPSGVVPAQTFYRYYFQLDLADNEFVESASADTGATLTPNVSIQGTDTIVVEVAPGMQIGNGFDALINLNIEVAGSEVSGRIWQDLNNNGVRDSGEGWLNGFEVALNDEGTNEVARTYSRNIDLNNDGLINPATEAGIYLFEGVQNGRLTVAQDLPYAWTQSSPQAGSSPDLVELRDSLGLRESSNEFLNYAGLNEKWVQGDNFTWFYITPNGSFYQWDGISPRTALVSTLIQTVDASVYDDLSLLYNAGPGIVRNVDVTVPTPVTGLDFGNYLAPPDTFYFQQNTTAKTVFFDWHPAQMPEGGTVQIWIANVSTGRRFEVTSGHVDSFTSSGPNGTGFPDGRYRVWARIEASPGVYSGWTSGLEFEFFRPAVQTPFTGGLNAGIDATPTVQWAAVPNAVSYDVLVDSFVYRAEKIVGLSHRIAQPLSLGTHSIVFRANYADGSRTAWSNPQTLTVTGQPTVTVTGNVVAWTAVPAATEYELWVDRIDGNGNQLTRQALYVDGIQDLNYTIDNLPNGRYSVWVRAIRAEDGLRQPSFWSNRVDFRLTSADGEAESIQPLLAGESMLSVFPVDESRQAQEPVAMEVAERAPVEDNEVQAHNRDDLPLVNAIMAELASTDMLDGVTL